MVNLSPQIDDALTTGNFSFSINDFWQFWDEAGKPEEVEVTLKHAEMIRRIFDPTDCRPIDNSTFQMPFLRLHVARPQAG